MDWNGIKPNFILKQPKEECLFYQWMKYINSYFIGIVHQFCFYSSNLIFWIVMGCGIADTLMITQHSLRSHKIYRDLTRYTEISQDLLRSHKTYWDLTRSTKISQDLLILPKICHLIFRLFWHFLHFYILTFLLF